MNYPDNDLADPAWNKGAPWHALYFGENYARLQRIKVKWDPRNVVTHSRYALAGVRGAGTFTPRPSKKRGQAQQQRHRSRARRRGRAQAGWPEGATELVLRGVVRQWDRQHAQATLRDAHRAAVDRAAPARDARGGDDGRARGTGRECGSYDVAARRDVGGAPGSQVRDGPPQCGGVQTGVSGTVRCAGRPWRW
ncbi:BBE domain-containing protein [Streptomyces vastus]|uniref:BBE domain-containing protein n=1 Tax=Streptomyces vastus TaxID=285451 RepID=UPI003CD062D5